MVQELQNELVVVVVVVVGTRFRFVLVKNNENCVVLTLCVSIRWVDGGVGKSCIGLLVFLN